MDWKEIKKILIKEKATLILGLVLILIGIIIGAVVNLLRNLIGVEIKVEATATLIVGVCTVIVGVKKISTTVEQSNKNTFINTITIARKEYMITLRKTVTEFCIAAEREDNKKLKELSYKLKMLMNPACDDYEHWDRKAIKMIDTIVEATNKKKHVNEFVTLMQSWIALEWGGMTAEGKQGSISEKEKQILRNKYYLIYTKWIEKKDNGQKQHTAI